MKFTPAMVRTLFVVAALFATLAATTTISAQPLKAGASGQLIPLEKAPPKVAEMARRLMQNGGMTAQIFSTPSGLYGIAMEKDAHVQVFYTDRDARTMTVGMMLDTQTKADIGSGFIAKHLPGRVDMAAMLRSAATGSKDPPKSSESPDRPASSAELDAVRSANGPTTTASTTPNRELYAFIDPQCGYCAKAWEAMSRMADPKLKNYRVKWIPMTLAGELDQVAALLPDDASLYLARISGAMASALSGTVAPVPKGGVSEASKVLAQRNLDLVKALQVNATPTFIVETSSGKFARREGFSTVGDLLKALD